MEMTWDLADVEQLGLQVTEEFGLDMSMRYHFQVEKKPSGWVHIIPLQTEMYPNIPSMPALQNRTFAMALDRIEVAIDFNSQTILYMRGRKIAHFITALTSQMMGMSSQVLGFLTDLRVLVNRLSEQSHDIQR